MPTTNGSFTCEVPVFYATSEGQTRRIADRIVSVLHDYGLDSRAIDITSPEAGRIEWTHVHGAIVGASLHGGRHQKAADRFVRAHVVNLNYVPSAFVSVSLSAASKNPKEVKAAEDLATTFPAIRGWKPAVIASVAGRLAYRQYGFVIRLVMQWIARKEGAPTDTSRDYELTNWEEVEKLARDMAAFIRTRTAVA